VQSFQDLNKMSVVKGPVLAVNAKKFQDMITEEPISRILKSTIQETAVRLE
jgi:hypothetical protein